MKITSRYGFEREPDARRTGDERLERPLRMHLLLSALRSLRPGNVHSADGWEGVLTPVVERYQRHLWPRRRRELLRARCLVQQSW